MRLLDELIKVSSFFLSLCIFLLFCCAIVLYGSTITVNEDEYKIKIRGNKLKLTNKQATH